MKVNLKNGEFISVSEEFPMNIFEIRDTLDRLKIPDDKPIVQFSISEYDNMKLPMGICHREFSADIYKLNLFVERYEQLEEYQKAGFKSVLMKHPDSSIDDMLLMTYGTEGVPVYPVDDYADLGEIAVDNEMLPELNDCSNEIIELLDLEKVGKLLAEREEGLILDGYYCVPSSYEKPDMNIEIGRPESCFFRLLIVPEEGKIEQAQWISLPYEMEITSDFCNGICLDFQSSLPNLKFDDAHKIGTLNELAERISHLSHDAFVKLKAVMEAENICEISDTLDCISRLDEYGFDINISDQSEFGRTYLARNLPANFNISMLENMDLFDFGQGILCHKQGEITSYGAVSGGGQELYSALTIEPEQQLEEELEEDFKPEMGGMSL